jgi:serine/threonine-protein kinase
MSPEQAKGRAADKRSDVWAFGCVLYEMLTGARAFPGEDVSDTLAAVLRGEPAWGTLPAETPAAIRRLLRRCLEKDRKRRLSDAADARLEIEDALTTPAAEVSAAPTGSSQGGWRRAAIVSAVALASAVVSGTVIWMATRSSPPRVTRTTIEVPGMSTLTGLSRHFSITPDASRVVYQGLGEILVRRFDQLEPTPLGGLGRPQAPFVSPDGQWVGFWDPVRGLRKVSMTGGPPVTLFQDARVGPPRGASWGPDGTIVFASAAIAGLRRISADGGEIETLTKPDVTRGVRHLYPEFLPDGKGVIFTIFRVRGGSVDLDIALLNLETRTETVLIQGGSHAHYVPTGHLVYGTGNTLRAVAFDLERRIVIGTPVPVLTPVGFTSSSEYEFDVASDGTLVYLPGFGREETSRSLVWVDRQGRETPIEAPARPYQYPRLSPDGARVVVRSSDQELDLWIWDLPRGVMTRGTLDPASDVIAAWTPDNKRLVFSSSRGGTTNLWVQPADGTGSATRLLESPNVQHPTDVTPDGSQVVFYEITSDQQRDIRLLTLGAKPKVTPLVATRFDERGGVVSPDGRWLAYDSNTSGTYEVYVRPFPAVDDGFWQVSTGGGGHPLWARSGRELFYVAADGALMAAPVEASGSVWVPTVPSRLFDGSRYHGYGAAGGFSLEATLTRSYDVTADGQRFLMIKGEAPETRTGIVVVQNWSEELKRLVTTR